MKHESVLKEIKELEQALCKKHNLQIAFNPTIKDANAPKLKYTLQQIRDVSNKIMHQTFPGKDPIENNTVAHIESMFRGLYFHIAYTTGYTFTEMANFISAHFTTPTKAQPKMAKLLEGGAVGPTNYYNAIITELEKTKKK